MIKEEFINEILTEVCLRPEIKSGMFDVNLQEHIDVLIDVMSKKISDLSVICEFTNKLNEGKFPDRQAYTKNGFLVTFPTPEQKSDAIRSGEYFTTDPTGGKGGMHMVRKKYDAMKKRMPQDGQQKQIIKKLKPKVNPLPKAIKVGEPIRPSDASKTKSAIKQKSEPHSIIRVPKIKTKTQTPLKKKTVLDLPQEKKKDSIKYVSPVDKTKSDIKKDIFKSKGKLSTYVTKKPTKVKMDPLDLPGKTEYRDESLEWAHNQKWIRREDNNYYDENGKLMAITSLDGKAIPSTDTGRQSLRKFIEKKKKERV